MTEERLAELMVKHTDGLATPSEKEELMAFVADKPELQTELQAHQALTTTTLALVERLHLDAALDRLDQQPATVAARGIGTALAASGLAVITGGGTATLLADPGVPLWLRAGTALLVAGTTILGVIALRARLASTNDPYSEVIR